MENRTSSITEIEYRRQRLMAARRREWVVLSILLAAVLLFGANFKLVRVSGRSMEPTFHNGQTLLIWKTARYVMGYRTGDVVVFQERDNPGSESDTLIKRIVFIQDAHGTRRMPRMLQTPVGPVYVKILTAAADHTEFPDYQESIERARRGEVLHRTLYMMGDNVWNSVDSRDFGPIDPDDVLGLVVAPIPQAVDSGAPPSNTVMARLRWDRQGRRG